MTSLLWYVSFRLCQSVSAVNYLSNTHLHFQDIFTLGCLLMVNYVWQRWCKINVVYILYFSPVCPSKTIQLPCLQLHLVYWWADVHVHNNHAMVWDAGYCFVVLTRLGLFGKYRSSTLLMCGHYTVTVTAHSCLLHLSVFHIGLGGCICQSRFVTPNY